MEHELFAGTKPQFGDPVGDPHLWFAWKPVRTFDRRFVWLRKVYRQAVFKHQYLRGGSDWWYRYALPPAPTRKLV